MSRPRLSLPRRSKVGHLRSFVRFFRDSNASLTGKLFVLATIAYVVWPIDLIPDFAPVVGWLDDLGVASIALLYLTRVAKKYRHEQLTLPGTVDGEWPQTDAYSPEYARIR